MDAGQETVYSFSHSFRMICKTDAKIQKTLPIRKQKANYFSHNRLTACHQQQKKAAVTATLFSKLYKNIMNQRLQMSP
jgi:hypothetical protein